MARGRLIEGDRLAAEVGQAGNQHVSGAVAGLLKAVRPRHQQDWLAATEAIDGEAFVDHYVRTRDWEVREYDKAVTDWELSRYFEVI